MRQPESAGICGRDFTVGIPSSLCLVYAPQQHFRDVRAPQGVEDKSERFEGGDEVTVIRKEVEVRE